MSLSLQTPPPLDPSLDWGDEVMPQWIAEAQWTPRGSFAKPSSFSFPRSFSFALPLEDKQSAIPFLNNSSTSISEDAEEVDQGFEIPLLSFSLPSEVSLGSQALPLPLPFPLPLPPALAPPSEVIVILTPKPEDPEEEQSSAIPPLNDFIRDEARRLNSKLSHAHPSFTASRSNSKGRAYSCPIQGCHKNYRRKGDLKFHVTHKHPSQPYLAVMISPPKSGKNGKRFPCPVESCDCGYKFLRDLKRHAKAKHEDLPEFQDEPEVIVGRDGEVHFDEKGTATWLA